MFVFLLFAAIFFPSLDFFPLSVKIFPLLSLLYVTVTIYNFNKLKFSSCNVILYPVVLLLALGQFIVATPQYLSPLLSCIVYCIVFSYIDSSGFKLSYLGFRSICIRYRYIFLLLSLVAYFSIALNYFSIPFPYVKVSSVSSGYLQASYRLPGFLGLIGSSGSIAYASFFLLSLIPVFLIGKRWFLCSIPFFLLSILSGSSGLVIILAFFVSYFFLSLSLSNFRFPRRALKNSLLIFIFSSAFFFSFYILIFLLTGRYYGLVYISNLFQGVDLTTQNTSGYLFGLLSDLPVYIYSALSTISASDLTFSLGMQTYETLPSGTDSGIPNLLLLFGLPATLLWILFIIYVSLVSFVKLFDSLRRSHYSNFLSSLSVGCSVGMLYLLYKEPFFVNTPAILPLYLLSLMLPADCSLARRSDAA